MSAVLKNDLDTARVEAFEERLCGALNEGGMLLMMSLGHRSGLLAAMAGAPPLTSGQLAERAGLNERYVREWLGAMTASRVVKLDPAHDTYTLPDEHAALITDAGEANMAVYAQFFGLLGSVEEDILECFRNGGGVPYERFERFHEVMAEDSGQTVLPALFDHILPLVPGLTGKLAAGINVLDVGCGRGKALMLMAERFPNSRFTGYDLSEEAIEWARERAVEKGLDNIRFEVRDVSDFDTTAEAGAFDFITTFDAVHDQARPLNVLTGIRKSLAADGVYLAQDIRGTSHHHLDSDLPLAPFLYAVSTMHCMTVSLAQDGEGLGTMWGEERVRDYMRRAGFSTVEKHQLDHDEQNDYFVMRA